MNYFIRERGTCKQVIFTFNGKKVTRAIKADSLKAAERLAPLLIEAYAAEHYRGVINPLIKAAKPKAEATVNDLMKAYAKASKRCNGITERENRQAFLRIAMGITRKGREEVGSCGLSSFSPASMMAWQAKSQGLLCALPDLSTRRASNRTINSCMAAAASLLTPSHQYQIEIPQSLRDAFAVPRLPVPRTGWNPWPVESYKAMAEAGDELTGDLWLAHQLFRRLGLRASEAKAAHSSWIRPMSGGRIGLAIQDYPEQLPHPFAIKGTQARTLPIPADLVRAITYRSAKGGYLLDGERKFNVVRGKVEIEMPLVDQDHVEFLRQFCPEGVQKPNHELRKWVGAIIYSARSAEEARAFLGHSDIKVLLQHYSAYIGTIEVDSLLKTIE